MRMQMYIETWKLYVPEALAPAYVTSHVHDFIFSVHLGGLAPPPPYQKTGYATDLY